MMKWFRKHNKKLLAIVVVFLMIVFVGGQALQDVISPEQGKRVIARAFGREVTMNDLQVTGARTQILQALGVPWSMPAAHLIVGDYMTLPDPIDVPDWYCLVEEARRMGVVVSRDEVENLRKQQPGLTEAMERVRQSRNIGLDLLYDTIADFSRVLLAARIASTTVQLSEAEIKHFIRDMYEKVAVKVVPLAAPDFVDREAELSDEMIQAHFEKYKQLVARTTPATPDEEDSFGYGYRWSERVAVEYVKADVDAILAGLPEPVIERVKGRALDYYRKNRQEFTVTEVPAAEPNAPEGASTQPVERTKSFSEVQEQVEQQLLLNEAIKRASNAMEQLADDLRQPWYEAEEDAEGFKQAPEVVKDADYLKDAAAKVTAASGIELNYVAPVVVTPAEARSLAGIGRAYGKDSQNLRLPFATYAFRVQGLSTASEGRASDVRLSLYEAPGSALRDSGPTGLDHSFYLFRVVRMLPSEVPASVDEVRDAVEQDLRESLAYEQAKGHALKLAEMAAEASLTDAVEASTELKAQLGNRFRVIDPPAFARSFEITPQHFQYGMTDRRPSYVSGVGSSQRFVDACFEMASEAQDADTPPIRVIELPALKRVVAVQWVASEPVTDKLYVEKRAQATAMLRMMGVRTFRNDWFSSERIRQRAGYEPVVSN